MDEADRVAMERVHDALVQRGFERLWDREVAAYKGVLDPTGLKVPVAIEVTDLNFVRPPSIYLEKSYTVQGRRLPHLLGESRAFCYFASGAVVLDRYNPGGTILQCLEQADDVIRKAVNGSLDDDFADEFNSYWSSTYMLVDLPADFVGNAKVRFLDIDSDYKPMPVLCLPESWLTKLHLSKRRRLPDGDDCLVIRTDKALSLDPNEDWPPASLSSFNRWLQWVAPLLVGTLETMFATGDTVSRWVAIRAPNGTYVYSLDLPTFLQKPEFQKSRKGGLPRVLNTYSNRVPVKRTGGVPADVDYIFSRNMGGIRNLSGKRILLIGVGTIGGFLAQQLAQSGAGSAGGRLTLVDKDTLQTANLGRHLLGVPYLDRNKALGCETFLKQQLPMLDIRHRDEDALKHLVNDTLPYDLIVDATGEEAFSLTLNERAIRSNGKWPPILFGYLLGNGAMAQGLLTGERDHACLKCLKPRLSGEPRFPSLRPDVEVTKIANLECADTLHIPYPVTRSVMAAALICEMALAWAGGAFFHRFRSSLYDHSRAFQIKDGNPTPSQGCPACRPT